MNDGLKATLLSAGISSGLTSLGLGAALLVLALIITVMAKLALERALALDVDRALFEEDNPAVALVAAGYYAGVAAVLWAAFGGAERSWLRDLLHTAAYGAWGVVLLALAVRLAAPVLLPGFRVGEELSRDRNAGTGIVMAAASLASGLVVAGSIHGEAPGGLLAGLLSTTAAFLLGQLGLGLCARLYGRVAGFDIHAEIVRDNTAAGCALAGALLASGVLLGWGVSGDLDPQNLGATFAPLGIAIVASLLLMPVVRLLVSRLFFAGIPFEAEIRRDHNLAAGIVDLMVHVLLAVLLVRLLA